MTILTTQRMRQWTAAANEGKVALATLDGMLKALQGSDAWDRDHAQAKRLFAALMSAKRSKEGKKRVKAFTPEERAAMRRAAVS
jgi:hypothetical protein